MSDYRPYPAYKDSGVEWLGEVPEHWELKPLWTITNINQDERDKFFDDLEEIEYVDISTVTLDGGISSPIRILAKDAPSRAQRKAKAGDIVISTVRTYLRAIGKVLPEHESAIFSTGFAIVRPANRIAPEFLYYALLSDYFLSEVEARSSGISYPAINASDLSKISIAIPVAIEEQIKLARLLDQETARIDALIAKKTRFIELLREKRQALITQAVTQGLDPAAKRKDSGVEWLGEVPEHWEIKTLKYIAKFCGGGTPARDNLNFWNGDIPWVSPKDMKVEDIYTTEEYITQAGLKNSATSLVPQDQVLLVVRSGILKHTVPVAINKIVVALNQDMRAILFNPEDCMQKFFLRWVQGFNNDLLKAWLKQGATVESIEHDYLANTILPLPSITEQQTIIAYLDRETTRIDTLITKTQQSLDLLKERRAALITAAVTGQIDLRESDAITAFCGSGRGGSVRRLLADRDRDSEGKYEANTP